MALEDPDKTAEGSPVIARGILKFLLRKSARETLAGDFEEIFRMIRADQGAGAARRWYWRHLLRSIPGILAGSAANALAMTASYIKVSVRSMMRQKVFSAINIFGLATGLTCFILIGLYASFEFGYDSFHHDPENVYRVSCVDKRWMNQNSTEHAASHMALAGIIRGEFPEVTAVTSFFHSDDWLVANEEGSWFEGDIISASPGFFDVFDFRIVRGTAAGFGEDPFHILVSESMARKYFGLENPVGKHLLLRGEFDFQVAGVLEDPPVDSHFQYNCVIPLEAREKMTGLDISSWSMIGFTYLRVAGGADVALLEEKLNRLPERLYAGDESLRERAGISYSLQPLLDIHLHSRLNFELSSGTDIRSIMIALSAAFLILLIACVNYINLSTARASKRSREVGIRKVIGARKGQLVQQFLGEAFVFTFVAFVAALLLAAVLAPRLDFMTGKEMTAVGMLDTPFLLMLAGLFVFVSLVAGAYPAFLISSGRPVDVLHYSFSTGRGRIPLRSFLIVFQFAVSIFLIVCSLAVKGQLDYIAGRDMGYRRDRIVVASLQWNPERQSVSALKARLLESPAIEGVTVSSHLPSAIDFQTRAHWPGMDDETVVMMNFVFADYDYVDVFGMTIVDGRNFSQDHPEDGAGAFILNEKAVSVLGWEDPVGRDFDEWMCGQGMATGKITGVVKDFNNLSLHHVIEPLFILLPGRFDNPRLPIGRFVSARIRSGATRDGLGAIEAGLREFFPEQPPDYSFFDDIAAGDYENERRAGMLLAASTSIALVIACVGLFGLISFTAEQRTKEIGIRKTLGASAGQIMMLLTRGMIGLVVLANLIAWPLAWIAVERWMRSFEYRAGINWGFFALAGASALALTLLTVSAQALKAARTKPVECLRYE